MKKFLLIIVCGIAIFSGCVKTLTVSPNGAIALTLDTLRMTAGQSQLLISKNYAASNLSWQSSDSTIANVSTVGLITAKKIGQTTITVNNKANTASATCLVIVTATITVGNNQITGKGTDIGVGADSSVFVVGTDVTSSTGGYSISKLVNGVLVKLPDCAAIRVAVTPQGVPWVVNKSNLFYRYNGTSWDLMPGNGTDIGIGADGSIFAIGTQNVSPTGGFNIMKWNGSSWDTLQDCSGIHIAVAPNGIPWVVNKSNIVYQNSGGVLWNAIPGVAGNDIGIGADGSVFVTGKDSTLASYQPPIYKYVSGGWNKLSNVSGISISVSPKGVPFWIDKSNNIYKLSN